jgi:hypothetical protein
VSITIYTPSQITRLAEECAPIEEFPRFCYDGFGVRLSDEQVEAHLRLGEPGPRRARERKENYLSGGQRSGKTVELALWHARACLYKTGVDNADRVYWNNYLYKTLGLAPSTDLTLKLWQVMDEISKGASDAQFDKRMRASRGGVFTTLMKAGKAGQWPVVEFDNGARTDFRSTEGWATRLEGDQWWFITWDEWASQPDREIEFVKTDVLMGRARDHDAKLIYAAWPKAATERHLMAAIREIETGANIDAQVIYLSAAKAYFTNFDALKVEKRKKDDAQWKRTVLGEPAGGASIEFKPAEIDNMVREDIAFPALREEGYTYFSSWDIGLSHDATVGLTWRIPIINGRPTVATIAKARIVNATELRPSPGLTLDAVAFNVMREQQTYRSQSAVDASGLGGVAAFRQLRDMTPSPLSFVSRSNDRVWGNMRLAAITNGLDMLSWARDGTDKPWGLIEAPKIQKLIDQLANFDRDAKGIADDWVWSFLIGCWYIRRYWVVGNPNVHRRLDFALPSRDPVSPRAPVMPRRTAIPLRRH